MAVSYSVILFRRDSFFRHSVIPIPVLFTLRSLSQKRLHKFNWNLKYACAIGINRICGVHIRFVPVMFDRVLPLELRKTWKKNKINEFNNKCTHSILIFQLNFYSHYLEYFVQFFNVLDQLYISKPHNYIGKLCNYFDFFIRNFFFKPRRSSDI